MPRSPILPVLDWREIFSHGLDYKAWIRQGESPEKRDVMEERLAGLELEAPVEGFLQALPRQVYIVAFAEDWCGDVVRHTPILQKLANAAPKLEVRYLARNDRPDVFVRFLTNGGEAIPKFVFLSEAFVECGAWGPMPALCRDIIARGKACGDVPLARQKVKAIYEAGTDSRLVTKELLHRIAIASAVQP